MKRAADDSDDAPETSTKRPRGAHTTTKALLKSILANPKGYPISANEDVVRKSLVDLAKYAQWLETQVAAVDGPVAGSSATAAKKKSAAAPAPAAKTKAQLEADAEKLRRAVVSGIKKQMSWKPSCKTGSAKWLYDGICPDPEVFGVLLGLGGPPTFKQKKVPLEDFEKCMGEITGSVRYDTLFITSGHVNVRWSDTGEFKISGTYGKYKPMNTSGY
ncbi:uncharacterized protein BXZ73DRAFT_52546 [Epithele typhae]|uniref:uncharacterized protein n=1 Tax=Epithele typhae TaxID=378194 RepID=UPI002008983C|nr:uncharacterized protein BXZ73DRAFT_52546 [Epithele typhae]KAH9919463.1 hypothetical protein BXZ73DRAFT_52546 [Epithele typhae]